MEGVRNGESCFCDNLHNFRRGVTPVRNSGVSPRRLLTVNLPKGESKLAPSLPLSLFELSRRASNIDAPSLGLHDVTFFSKLGSS